MTLAQATSTFQTALNIWVDSVIGLLTTGNILYLFIIGGAIYWLYRKVRRTVHQTTRL